MGAAPCDAQRRAPCVDGGAAWATPVNGAGGQAKLPRHLLCAQCRCNHHLLQEHRLVMRLLSILAMYFSIYVVGHSPHT